MGNPSDYKIVDLFSGAGGFSKGFEQAGFTVNQAFDYNENAIETYNSNHAGKGTVQDLTDVKPLELCDKDVDIVIGSPPCQDFSLANYYSRGGEKTNLVWVYRDYIEKLNPDAFLMENVEGMKSTGDILLNLVDSFRELGYTVTYMVVDCKQYGIAQKRRRMFIAGSKEGKFRFPQPNIQPSTVGEAFEGLPSLESGESSKEYLNHKAPDHDDSTIEKIKDTGQGESIYESWSEKIRLDSDKPSPTVKAGKRANFHFAHPEDDRGLSIRERARLQSFPDSFEFEGSITEQRKQVGNAVPPKVSEKLAYKLDSHLKNGGEKMFENFT